MSSMMVSRVPYADAIPSPEVVAPPGEAAMAGNGQDAPEGRRRFRRKRADGKDEEPGRLEDKRRPGAYFDLLI